MAAEGVFTTPHKLTTALHRLDDVAEDVREFRAAVTTRLERVELQLADLRERVARVEASREADLAKLQAEAARFKAEIERAELRLVKQLPKRSSRSKKA